ncbi:hypothetical protein D3C72_2542360 [compost metagenome]
MPLEERRDRWQALMAAARTHNVDDWAMSFLERLAPGALTKASASRDVLYLASVA